MTGGSREEPRGRPVPVALWLILGLAFLVRLPWLFYPWLHDEAALQAISRDVALGRVDSFFPMPYVTALYPALVGWITGGLGESMLVPRLISTASTLASTFVLFQLGRRLGGEACGLAAATLFVLSPLMMSLPAVGAMDDPLLVLLALDLVLRGLQERRTGLLAAGGLVIGASIYVRFFFGPIIPLFFLLLLVVPERGRRLRSAGAFAGGAALAGLPMVAILALTEGGREVLGFVGGASGGMHTRLAESLSVGLLDRVMETGWSVAGVLLGTMDAGGPTPRALPDVVAFGLVLGGTGLLAWRALRGGRGPADEAGRHAGRGERLVLGWLVGSMALLLFLFAWPSEAGLREGLRYRAPRYAVMVCPSLWLAAGLAFGALHGRLRTGRPTWAMALLPALVVTTLAPTLSEIALVDIERGKTPLDPGVWLLSDAPVGSAVRWTAPEFPLDRAGLLELVGDDTEGLDRDPRVALMRRHPQLVYGVQPPVYWMDYRFAAWVNPGLLTLRRQPLPPVAPLEAGIPGGRHHRLVVVVSSERLEETTPGRAATTRGRFRPDRIADLRVLQQGLPPSRVVEHDGGEALATLSLSLPDRSWSSLDLRVGSEGEALAAPDRLWAFPHTLYTPWLGYGFSHALIDLPGEGPPSPVSVGARPIVPVDLQVRAPVGSYAGVVELTLACGGLLPGVEVQGAPPGPPEPGPCVGGVQRVELPFTAQVHDEAMTIHLRPRGDGTGWSFTGLRFERLPGEPLETTGVSEIAEAVQWGLGRGGGGR